MQLALVKWDQNLAAKQVRGKALLPIFRPPLVELKYDTMRFGLKFYHERYDAKAENGGYIFRPVTDQRGHRIRAVTTCEIVDLDLGKVISDFEAKCSWTDNFCKATGRKLALGRALLALHPDTGRPLFSKGMRGAIWNAYWTKILNFKV